MKKPACGPAFSLVPWFFATIIAAGEYPYRIRTPQAPLHRRADPLRHFPILLDDAPEIAAEAVLVHLVVRPVIPESAAVGREFVAENQRSAHVVHGMPELQLVVDQIDRC